MTAAYTPATAVPPPRDAALGTTPPEVFERAAAHGDEHVIKLTDTALDVAGWDEDGDISALAAALRSTELISPAS